MNQILDADHAAAEVGHGRALPWVSGEISAREVTLKATLVFNQCKLQCE